MQDNKGRGAQSNASGRFNALHVTLDDIAGEQMEADAERTLKTQYFSDHSKTIVAENDSPDLGFRYSLNAYRGCEHGCAYCYARPTHEYLGLSAGLDFESKIFVKENAAALLREKLQSPKWVPETIFMSGVTDCYQPAERKFKLTRACLEVLAEFRNPVALITKNALVTRDIDILQDMAKDDTALVYLSITTLDKSLARSLEPRTSSPDAKLRAIEALAKAGIPVGVNVAPVIPGLTDHEIPAILKAAQLAGATRAGHVLVRLPYSVKTVFSEWLAAHRPEAKDKILNAIKAVRGGKLNDGNFGSRMKGSGPEADTIHQLFELFVKKFGLDQDSRTLSITHFKRKGAQLSLF